METVHRIPQYISKLKASEKLAPARVPERWSNQIKSISNHVAVFTHAAFDVASGLKYLHQNNIAHRDLKPTNILVSNRHYHYLSDQEKVKQIISIKPHVCKLADYILKSRTNRVDRGK